MAAENIDAILTQEAGRIDEAILQKNLHTSPWIDLPKTGTWPEGMGHTIQILTYDRSLPDNSPTWTDITVSSGEAGGVCLPPTEKIKITQTLREMNLQHTALESPDICVNDLRNTFIAEEQLNAVTNILAQNQQQVWINRNRELYLENALHKVVVTTDGLVDNADGDWPSTPPTSKLSGGHLLRCYRKLIRIGGNLNGGLGMKDGKPMFPAIGGMETFELIQNETNYRQDLRESSRVPELLAPLGVDRFFRGLWLVDDVLPPRSNFVGSAFVEVPAMVWDVAIDKWVENPAYDTALYEDTYIFHPTAMEVLTPAPAKSYGKASFDNVSLRGDWRWLNIQERATNPDKTMGFFRGVFMSGMKPKFPEYGFVLRHLRCDIPVEAAACSDT